MGYLVYVLNNNNEPLMPTKRFGKVRHLLKNNLAKVVRKEPFTIRLLYDSTNYTQELTLGVDTGSGTFATAVYNNTSQEIIYMSEVEVRNDITKKMTQRSKYRRTRRTRKTRYRKPRFLNRKNSKKLDRFSPTMLSKINSHKKEVEFIKSILPITTLVFETATFDTHLLKNPALANENYRRWGYQKGSNYGFSNTRAKVLYRDGYKCQYCKNKRKDSKLDVHHIIFRSKGGSDFEENLITLCHSCHVDLHDNKIHPNFKGKKKSNLKYATQMNSIRCQLLKFYPESIETFGYVTKENRFALKLPKEHYFDACVIASAGNPIKFAINVVYFKKSVADGDYQQTKGVRSQQSINTGKINSFRKFDKVLYQNNIYFIKGRMSTGYAVLMNIKGIEQKFTNPKTVKLCNLNRISARKSILVKAIPMNVNFSV